MSPLSFILALATQVPFHEPPAVTTEPLPTDAAGLDALFGPTTPLPFADDEGYVYANQMLRGFALTSDARCVAPDHPDATDNQSCDAVRTCWHPADPDGTRRYLYMDVDVSAFESRRHEGLVVWDEGLVAVVPELPSRARTFKCTVDGVAPDAPLGINRGEQRALPPFHAMPLALGRRVCGFWNADGFVGGPERWELACLGGPEDFAVASSGAPIFAGATLFGLDQLDEHLAIAPLASNADGRSSRCSTRTTSRRRHMSAGS